MKSKSIEDRAWAAAARFFINPMDQACARECDYFRAGFKRGVRSERRQRKKK